MHASEGLEDRLYVRARRPRIDQPLPLFAKGAIQLGRELYLSALNGEPRLSVIVVPVRDYFALFLAVGAAYAALTCRQVAQVDPAPGQAVVALFPDGRYYTARYEGDVESLVLGKAVKTAQLVFKNGKTLKLPAGSATLMPVSDEQIKNHHDYELKALPASVTKAMSVYGLPNPIQLLRTIEPTISLIGTKASFDRELSPEPFGLVDRDIDDLSFSDLLLTKQGGLAAPLAEIIPSTGGRPSANGVLLRVFDGANTVLRHELAPGNGSSVVVIEASTPTATIDLAASTIYNATVFADPDPEWEPIRHPAFACTEWSVYKYGGSV